MIEPVWVNGLQTLRRQFEVAGERHVERNRGQSLRCALVHAGPEHGDKLEDEEMALIISPASRSIDGGFGVLDTSDPPTSARRRHVFVGDQAGVNRFIGLARQAQRCLHQAPRSVLQEIPMHVVTARILAVGWVWAVYELAWQRRAGSVLEAQKKIWLGCTRYPYDVHRLTGFSKIISGIPDFMRAWIEELPDYFCSILDDAFLASCYAIDLLLSGAEASPATGTRPVEVFDVTSADIASCRTLKEIANYAKTQFGHRPAERSVQKWKAAGSLRIRRRGSLWDFSKSDLELLVGRPPKPD